MNHPEWYYKYYNRVLTTRRDYDNEINLIDKVVGLKGKRVQEIGAGTGEHSVRLLSKEVSCLELVDFDPAAAEILKCRFRMNGNVSIRCADGFSRIGNQRYDVIVCMYSVILLSAVSIQELYRRFEALVRRADSGGHIFFEIVDYDICLATFQENVEANLYKNGINEVNVRTDYSEKQLSFVYTGKLDGKEIHYTASLLRLNRRDLLEFLRSKEKSEVGCIDLDGLQRRILVWVRF